jgi:hypothetical protein
VNELTGLSNKNGISSSSLEKLTHTPPAKRISHIYLRNGGRSIKQSVSKCTANFKSHNIERTDNFGQMLKWL